MHVCSSVDFNLLTRTKVLFKAFLVQTNAFKVLLWEHVRSLKKIKFDGLVFASLLLGLLLKTLASAEITK